jgi:hypothetical protein
MKIQYLACSLPLDHFVNELDDEQLDALHSRTWQEKEKRTISKIKDGFYPALSSDEKRHAADNKLNAIKAYYHRTNLGLYLAKMVVEVFLGQKK